MKSQQIAVYESLNEFMVAVGYQNASDRREDDPVWSTLNENNFRAMMEYKFGVEPRLIAIPTTLAAVHEGITSHEAWSYREDLEHDDGEEAPAAAEPESQTDDGSGFTGGPADTGDQDLGGGTGEPASTEQNADGPSDVDGDKALGDSQPGDGVSQEPAQEGDLEGAEKQGEADRAETEEQQSQQEQTAEEGGDSEQE